MTTLCFIHKNNKEKRAKVIIKKVTPLPYTGSGCGGYGIELI
ncbi:MAG: hypothetical protein ACI35O_06195 [Bacillaceae bacterium]